MPTQLLSLPEEVLLIITSYLRRSKEVKVISNKSIFINQHFTIKKFTKRKKMEMDLLYELSCICKVMFNKLFNSIGSEMYCYILYCDCDINESYLTKKNAKLYSLVWQVGWNSPYFFEGNGPNLVAVYTLDSIRETKISLRDIFSEY